jgi:Fe-S-cluster containining protein
MTSLSTGVGINNVVAEFDPAISCASCEACCCRLEVILMGEDNIPLELTVEDKWGGAVMRRLEDGWCEALNRVNMKCSIYEERPGVCRDYQAGASECIGERSRLLGQQLKPDSA